MPYPKEGEKKEDYISRCMKSEEMNKKHPEQKERAAVCFSFWENKDKKKDKGSISDIDIIVTD